MKSTVFPETILVKQKIGGGDRLVNRLQVWIDFSTRDGVDRTRPANSWKLAVMRHKQSNLKITSLAFKINTALLSACTWPVRLGLGASEVLGSLLTAAKSTLLMAGMAAFYVATSGPAVVWAGRSPLTVFPRAGALLSDFSSSAGLSKFYQCTLSKPPRLLCWSAALLTAWPHPLVPGETGKEAEVRTAKGSNLARQTDLPCQCLGS